jgi:predicted DsbA family dithiol-disulfide isomerase
MALESPHVTAAAVAAVEYPDLVQQYRVTGVPKTVINDRTEILGAVPEAAFVSQVVESVG